VVITVTGFMLLDYGGEDWAVAYRIGRLNCGLYNRQIVDSGLVDRWTKLWIVDSGIECGLRTVLWAVDCRPWTGVDCGVNYGPVD